MCYVHNQWYDILCATLYKMNFMGVFYVCLHMQLQVL